MSSDVFIISAARSSQGPVALQQAVELAGLQPAQVQDAIFGLDNVVARPAIEAILRSAGLACPAASVSPGLRALVFAAASILSEDVQLLLAIGLAHDAAVALLLASPEAVGRLNLLPRARIAVHSLAGQEAALREAGLPAEEVDLSKEAAHGALLVMSDLLDELEAASRRWALLSDGQTTVLLERL
jgi:hypothetical protein